MSFGQTHVGIAARPVLPIFDAPPADDKRRPPAAERGAASFVMSKPDDDKSIAAARRARAALVEQRGQMIQMELAIDDLLAAYDRGADLAPFIESLRRARRPYVRPVLGER